MPVTFTIKQVPDRVAEDLRRRAASNRRSLQRELLLIIERAAAGGFVPVDGVAAPPPTPYASRHVKRKATGVAGKARAAGERPVGKLNLEELWERARALGARMPGESAELIRRDRDARNRR